MEDSLKLTIDNNFSYETFEKKVKVFLNFNNNKKNIKIDFSHHKAIDSSPILLMLQFIRYSKKNNFNLSFISVSHEICTMMQVYGVEGDMKKFLSK